MHNQPFLTDLDSRAAIKGSRDPLGIQQIWTRLGRQVIGNLTTVSNSVTDFKTLMLGYYFSEKVADNLGSGSELATFLKWEQLAAYSRAKVNDDWAFRGSERVRKNMSESSIVTVSDEPRSQILGNQKIYGLWGLYTVPARKSGLVDGTPPRLTPLARDVIEKLYLPTLVDAAGKDAFRISDLLSKKSSRIDLEKRDTNLLNAIGNTLKSKLLPREQKFYRIQLLYGGLMDDTFGRQRQLAELVEGTLSRPEFAWSPATLANLAKVAKARGQEWYPLAHRLHRIRTSETVMAPVSALFRHLLGLDGKSIGDVIVRLHDEWGTISTVDPSAFRELSAEIGGGDPTIGNRWCDIADSLASGAYANLIDLLILQNKTVMLARGGAPWIEVRSGKLNIRFRDEQGELPIRDELPTMWHFPYFLDSLRTVAAVLKEN